MNNLAALQKEYLDLLQTLSDLRRSTGMPESELKKQIAEKEKRLQKLLLLSHQNK